MNKISLSSTFLYEFDIDMSIADNYLIRFLDCKNIKEHLVYHEDRLKIPSVALSSTDENGNIISFYDKEMFDHIQLCLDQVSSLYLNFNVGICDSWVTRTKFGQIGSWHSHSHSIFSGLVYLTDHDECYTEFQIQDPLFSKITPWLSVDTVKNNNYIIKYKPQRGKMLIWPSTLFHRISMSRDKKTRYTFSFKSWVTGEVYKKLTGRLNVDIKL